jgi:hypothetical protein
VPGWFDPASPAPAPDEYLAQEAAQLQWPTTWTLGGLSYMRWETEQWAGGNASWNTGVDYRRQLERSLARDAVYALYRLAGLDPEADLRALAAAPRVQADPRAAASLEAFVFDGGLQVPVLTLHTTGDGNVLAAGVPPTPMPPTFIAFEPAPFLRPRDARCLPGVPVAPVTGGLGPVCL